jgi:toxin ParE1/3/4
VVKPAFHLTRRAALDLRDIYTRSCREWGENTADRYMAELYAAMGEAAVDPDAGRLRQRRATPFLMVPAQKHFVVYDRIANGIAILTLLHQVRDIENVIGNLTPAFLDELERLKRQVL